MQVVRKSYIRKKMDISENIEKLRNSEQEGFVAIYHHFYKPLLFFINGYLKSSARAEEILADVFMKVWTRRTDFQSFDSLRAFLYISAKNASLNVLREKKSTYAHVSLSEIEDLLSEDQDAFTHLIEVELIQSIFEEVEKLPERQRLVFNMTYLEDKTVEEIADTLKMTPSAVYANRSRAVHTIRLFFNRKASLASLPLFVFSAFKAFL